MNGTSKEQPTPSCAAFVGLGLIGGSMARDLRRDAPGVRLTGVEADPGRARRALELGLVDAVLPLDEAVAEADLCVIAVPVDVALHVTPRVLGRAGPDAAVTDVGSTKARLLEELRGHPRRPRFVGGHPMAGTENSGPDAASEGLFRGRIGILCEVEASAADAVERVRWLYRLLGMRVVEMDPRLHDAQAAYISHLSHVISYALALTVLERAEADPGLFRLAAGGFSSTARLAKSGADMWAPILRLNREALLPAVAAFRSKLDALHDAIAHSDEAALRRLIGDANAIRGPLEQPPP